MSVADAATGELQQRVELGRPIDELLLHASFDGRFWVGTFAAAPADGERAKPTSVVAVDFSTAAPTAVDLGCQPGTTAAIDRYGDPAPGGEQGASPAPAPTATPAPTAPTPGPSGAIDCNGESYPVGECVVGWTAVAISSELGQRGFPTDSGAFYDTEMIASVAAFQQSVGLPATGEVDAATWNALFTGTFGNTDFDSNGTVEPWEVGYSIAPSGDGEGEGDDQPTEGCGSYTAVTSYSMFQCSKGLSVAVVQMLLRQQGYDIVADGYFGPATYDAVRDYQAAEGLGESGFVGPETFDSLLADTAFPADPTAFDSNGNGVLDPWDEAILLALFPNTELPEIS